MANNDLTSDKLIKNPNKNGNRKSSKKLNQILSTIDDDFTDSKKNINKQNLLISNSASILEANLAKKTKVKLKTEENPFMTSANNIDNKNYTDTPNFKKNLKPENEAQKKKSINEENNTSEHIKITTLHKSETFANIDSISNAKKSIFNNSTANIFAASDKQENKGGLFGENKKAETSILFNAQVDNSNNEASFLNNKPS